MWLLAVVAVLAGAVAWAAGQDGWAAVLAAVAVVIPLAAYIADKASAKAGDLDVEKVADRLADQVKDQWSAEAKRRDLYRPPLAVSWQPADSSLTQPWSYLESLVAAGGGWTPRSHAAANPCELAGTGSDLVKVLDRVPTGRLVVLGEPGSGKTVLLIRLVLDILARRSPGEPVPLLVPLASWNPDRHDLYSWMESQIIREYPWLSSTSAAGVSRARALLTAGLVLPVLDGLDEIRSGGRDQALISINDTLHDGAGLVLSCRAKAFRHAIRPGPHRQPVHSEGAVGIRLDPLNPKDVADYLTETAGAGGHARWAPVRAALTTSPAPPVARALSTPLMASLARIIYNPPPGGSTRGLPNPADLCNAAELPTRAAVEEHLFDGFIPAAYWPRPGVRSRWACADAEPYLVFLARHLEYRLHTTSLAWWELHRAAPRMLSALAGGLAIGFVGGLGSGVAFELAYGLVVGLVFLFWFGFILRRTPSSPTQIVLLRPRFSALRKGAAFGLALAFVVGSTAGPVGGLAVGLVVVLVFWLSPMLGTTANTRRAADPRSSFTQDRSHALAGGLVLGLGFGLPAGLTAGLAFGFAFGFAYGLAFGPTAGLAVGIGSSWGRFGVARLWLAWSGRLPLALMTFLTDAHERGVLRQAGAVWEFRHASLQRRLANRP